MVVFSIRLRSLSKMSFMMGRSGFSGTDPMMMPMDPSFSSTMEPIG